MKSLYNKTLFKKEFKISKWMMILMTLNLLIFKILKIDNSLKGHKSLLTNRSLSYEDAKISMLHWFNHELIGELFFSVIMIFLIIMLVTLMFQNERSNSTFGFLASIPYKREEVIKTKWIVGVITIIIPMVISLICISIFYKYNKSFIDDNYFIILRWFFITTLQYICIYSGLFLCQTLMGQNIISSIVGAIIIYVPYGTIAIIAKLVYSNFNLKHKLLAKISDIMSYSNLYNFGLGDYVDLSDGRHLIYYLIYKEYNIKIIIMIILTVTFYILAKYYYKVNSLENTGKIFIFPSLKPVLIWGFAICFGLLSCEFIGLSNNNKILADICVIVGIPLGYFTGKKVVLIYDNK